MSRSNASKELKALTEIQRKISNYRRGHPGTREIPEALRRRLSECMEAYVKAASAGIEDGIE